MQTGPGDKIRMEQVRQWQASPYYKLLYQNKARILAWLAMPEGELFLQYLSQCRLGFTERLTYNPVEGGNTSRIESSDILRGKIMNMDEIINLPFILKLKAQEELYKLAEQMEKENANAVA